MLLLVLKLFGWLLAHTPEPLLRLFATVVGDFVFAVFRRRRRLILSNLHHAFPEKPAAWHATIGRASCRRMIETGLLSLATPFLGADRLRTIIKASPDLLALYAEHRAAPAATLICAPHIAYWEAQTSMPLVVPAPFPEFGTIYRPLDNAAADAFVKKSREHFGMRLLSRKEGFAEALKILRRRGFVGLLFDQNAGLQGALTTLFGRVCSTTELPGLMAEKFDARVFGIFPRRLDSWRVELGAQRIAHDGTSPGVTLALNRWLETLLASDDNICASWLWAHDRWRNQDMPNRRLRLEAKRDLLRAELAAQNGAGVRSAESDVGGVPPVSVSDVGVSPTIAHPARTPSLPRRTRIWIRLPNWLGDVVMALPLLRAIRAARPDMEITLVAKKQFLPLLESWAVADRVHVLPPKGAGYFAHFFGLRREFIDVWLLFTNSLRGDLEARLSGTRQRFGIARAGKSRPLLSHAFRVSADFDERTHHQLALWENFLRHFGLNEPLDLRPLHSVPETPDSRYSVGFIAGSENNPEKRWPVDHWRALIESHPGEHVVLFGTANDTPITSAIAAGFDPARVENLAAKTDLRTYCDRLRRCRVLVTNDTGGMHLANALGVPVIALFGPTNPLRTRPVFDAPVQILQPPDCPATGGGSLEQLRPETVSAALRAAATNPSLAVRH